jgi:hypothetical protein
MNEDRKAEQMFSADGGHRPVSKSPGRPSNLGKPGAAPSLEGTYEEAQRQQHPVYRAGPERKSVERHPRCAAPVKDRA